MTGAACRSAGGTRPWISVAGEHVIYFAGDTDIFPEMAELAPDLDLAILPVGGWGPTLRGGHMDAVRAAKALTLLRPWTAVAIHWGTRGPSGWAAFGGHGSRNQADDSSRGAKSRPLTVPLLLPGDCLQLPARETSAPLAPSDRPDPLES